MRIAIAGATGMVGTALSGSLRVAGHEVIPISRRALTGAIAWNPDRGELPPEALEALDAVVHLAGENLASGRWTEQRKRRIRESRVQSTALLAGTLARLARPPRVLVSASAIGYYGGRHGDEWLDEMAPPGDDFLARLCVAWEAAADPARSAGIRVVHPRIGLILSPNGGALARMLLPFRLGLGGRLGSGEQWLSWITIDDLVDALGHAITCATLSGPLNCVAPEPIRNVGFTRALAHALHRPAMLPAPAPLLRFVFGEMADQTLLASCRVSAACLTASGFEFRDGDLAAALGRLLA